jgi:hypothetical protein
VENTIGIMIKKMYSRLKYAIEHLHWMYYIYRWRALRLLHYYNIYLA